MALAVCDLRLLLEPEAVRRTILRGLDAATFKAGVERMVAAEDGEDVYERSLANRAFHRQIYAGCGNAALVKVLDDLTDVNALISVTVRRLSITKWPRTHWPDGQRRPPIVCDSTSRCSSNASSMPWAHPEVTVSRQLSDGHGEKRERE
jgi:DNA-binding GntR family transcriptional regulator